MSRPTLRSSTLGILVLVLGVTAYVQTRIPPYTQGGPLPDVRMFSTDFNAVQEVVRHVLGKVYVVAGAGSQVAVFAGDDGVLIVDNQFAPLSPKIVAAIRQVSDKSIKYVINTHSHPDHTGGNENFARMGATVFAHTNTRIRMMGGTPPGAVEAPGTAEANASFARRMAAMMGRDGVPGRGRAQGGDGAGRRPGGPGGRGQGRGAPAGPPAFPATPPAGLPVVTTSEVQSIHMNGEEVRIIPAPRPSHTDGDVFVYFPESNVIALGDVYTTDYPAIGPGTGGTSQGFIDNWNSVLGLVNDETKIVPGHGQISTRADLTALRDATLTIRERIRQMAAAGMTVEQVKAARPSREFDARFAMENVGMNDVFPTDLWYDIMYAEARAYNRDRR